MKSLHVRLDDRTHAKMQRLARASGRSLNAEINEACKDRVRTGSGEKK